MVTSGIKDSFLCLKRELRISGTNDKGGGLEVSVDRAGILPGPGEPVAPILSPLGRKEWRWQLQMLLTPKAASKCPKDSQELKGGGVREFSRSTSGLGVTPYWPRVAGV